MKKIVAIVLCLMMLFSTAACASSTGGTGNVGGFGNVADGDQEGQVGNNKNKGDKNNGDVEASAEILEMLGISAEEWAAMDPAQQEGIMAELGVKIEHQEKEEKEKETAKVYTPEDVMNGGNYIVVLGDYLNSITLHYENGKLVKIEESFRKSSEEPEEYYAFEGDSLKNYTFNFINWADASLQEILDGMKDYGGFGEYRIYPVK